MKEIEPVSCRKIVDGLKPRGRLLPGSRTECPTTRNPTGNDWLPQRPQNSCSDHTDLIFPAEMPGFFCAAAPHDGRCSVLFGLAPYVTPEAHRRRGSLNHPEFPPCRLFTSPPVHARPAVFRNPLENPGAKTPENRTPAAPQNSVPKSLLFRT